MSTAGIYNYRPKVEHPNKVFPQMESDGFQTPFYFGGSQVPINLGIHEGSGLHSEYKSHLDHMKNLSCKGRGIETTVHKNSKIYLPKSMKSIRK
jgi:hypothetical protein